MADINGYTELMAEYDSVTEEIKHLKAKKEELRTDLLIRLKTDDETKIRDDVHSMILTVNKRRSFLKDKALEFIAEHKGNVDDYYLESEYEMLKIKKIEELQSFTEAADKTSAHLGGNEE